MTTPLRIYRDDPPARDPGAAGLAARELLRPPAGPGRRELEPFSRGWFEELEAKRYARHGAWLRPALEFSRHPGQALLMLGPGVGTDALQYQRHGTEVTVCATPADRPDLVSRNFALRGLTAKVVAAGPAGPLPFPRGAFDLAYVNAAHGPPVDPAALAGEIYRVLKPGGKVFVLAPARYNAGFWQDALLPLQKWYWRRPADGVGEPRYSARGLRRLFGRFADHKVLKRHLRRAELPHPWRVLPLPLLERVLGSVLVLKAFKPVAAAKDEFLAAA